MAIKPDYTRARQSKGFSWSVRPTIYALMEMVDIPVGRDYNLQPELSIEIYKKGPKLFRELFPSVQDVPDLPLFTPPISYGHPNCLGSELVFPEIGEVAHTHIYKSLAEGIKALQQPVDWIKAGLFPFYQGFRETMQQAFPGQEIGLNFGYEGPITTAYELRGEAFFYDIMDDPAGAKEFLGLITASVLDFCRAKADLLGVELVRETAFMCDDLASVVPPYLFNSMVIPFWDQYYNGLSTHHREAHVEDLKPDQLPFLETIGLRTFDPSISHKINPRSVAARCRVPFSWRLGSFHFAGLDIEGVQDWVFQAVGDGASQVFTLIEGLMCRPHTLPKVQAFIEAAKQAEQVLAAGGTRGDVAALVSARGRARFWDHWPE